MTKSQGCYRASVHLLTTSNHRSSVVVLCQLRATSATLSFHFHACTVATGGRTELCGPCMRRVPSIGRAVLFKVFFVVVTLATHLDCVVFRVLHCCASRAPNPNAGMVAEQWVIMHKDLILPPVRCTSHRSYLCIGTPCLFPMSRAV